MSLPKAILYSAWFGGCFTLALLFTFPLDGLAPLVVTEAEKVLGKGKQGPHGTDPEVTVESLRVSGLGIKATRLHVRFGNREPEPGPEIDIDSLWVSASLMSFLSPTKTLQLQASLYSGDVDAEVSIDDKQNVVDVDIDVDGVDLAKVPAFIAKLGVAVEGKISADIDIDMGKVPEKEATGHIEFDVKGLGLGAGNLTAVTGGWQIAEAIKLGNLKGRVPVNQGVGTLELLKLEGVTEVEAEVFGTLNLRGRPLLSRLDADGWVRPLPAFLEKNPKVKSLIEIGEKLQLPGAPQLSKAKDEEGHYHFSIKGAVATLMPQLAKDGGKKTRARAAKPVVAPVAEAPPKVEP